MEGRATFTIDASSTTTNWAIASRARMKLLARAVSAGLM